MATCDFEEHRKNLMKQGDYLLPFFEQQYKKGLLEEMWQEADENEGIFEDAEFTIYTEDEDF